MLNGNGVAALGVYQVAIDVGGIKCVIPPTPAVGWVVPIVDDDWIGIVPGLVEGSLIDDSLSSGEISYNDCLRAARDAVGVASGLSWWSAVRLVKSALDSPEITGELVLRGVDAQRISLGAFVQATYRLFVRDTDKKARTRVDNSVKAPPPGLSAKERFDQVEAEDGFKRMMRSRGMSV